MMRKSIFIFGLFSNSFCKILDKCSSLVRNKKEPKLPTEFFVRGHKPKNDGKPLV